MKVVALSLLVGSFLASASVATISVCGDATFHVLEGPLCGGNGLFPTGRVCPQARSVASSNCNATFASWNSLSGTCVAGEDAVCMKLATGSWGCVFPSSGCAHVALSKKGRNAMPIVCDLADTTSITNNLWAYSEDDASSVAPPLADTPAQWFQANRAQVTFDVGCLNGATSDASCQQSVACTSQLHHAKSFATNGDDWNFCCPRYDDSDNTNAKLALADSSTSDHAPQHNECELNDNDTVFNHDNHNTRNNSNNNYYSDPDSHTLSNHSYSYPHNINNLTLPYHNYSYPHNNDNLTLPNHDYSNPHNNNNLTLPYHDYIYPHNINNLTLPYHDYSYPHNNDNLTLPNHDYSNPHNNNNLTLPYHDYIYPHNNDNLTLPNHDYSYPHNNDNASLPKHNYRHTHNNNSHTLSNHNYS
ncbi:Aste57867_13459 [Aphanomyces stellatus]|uniref:Aste57867_13459 protein n=1 Tax=Aphanomyces stellatus TaxID=120398 RepID=A0A485KYX7_9STRA|nr:hypothetical protein As57867_013409 [Aphanomyces stellatus]VFT90297.1 Aste57867_13459 [Aphanomyces stellatus]